MWTKENKYGSVKIQKEYADFKLSSHPLLKWPNSVQWDVKLIMGQCTHLFELYMSIASNLVVYGLFYCKKYGGEA